MQSATIPIKIGYKIRNLEQFENQKSDISWAHGGCHFEYLLPVNFEKPKKSPFSVQIVQIFFKLVYFRQMSQ